MRADFYNNNSDVSFLFVGYCDRSGSTFLLNELSKYSKVVICPEADILVRLLLKKANKSVSPVFLNKIRIVCRTDPKLRLWNVIPLDKPYTNRLDLFYSILLQFALIEHTDPTLVVFKERSILSYYKPLDSFPVEKFYLSLIRDPRAVFASQKKTYKSYKNSPLSTNPITTTRQWNAFNKNTISLRKRRENYKEIRYENMILNCDSTMVSVISFLGQHRTGLECLNNQSISFLSSLKDVKKHQLIGKTPVVERVSAWEKELSENEISIIEQTAKGWMQSLDYSNYLPESKKGFTMYYAKLRFLHFFSVLQWRITVCYRKILFIGLTNNQ